MNVLLFDDLFSTICLYFNIKDIINFELISTYHHRLIRKTTSFLPVLIRNETSLKHIIQNYHFKNLLFKSSVNVNLYLDYLKNCHMLDLAYTNINDESVKELKYCHKLNLSGTKITDNGLKWLTNCHTLYLYGTWITDEGVSKLNCHILDLSSTNITDEGIKAFKNRRLYLCHTKVTQDCKNLLKRNGCQIH